LEPVYSKPPEWANATDKLGPSPSAVGPPPWPTMKQFWPATAPAPDTTAETRALAPCRAFAGPMPLEADLVLWSFWQSPLDAVPPVQEVGTPPRRGGDIAPAPPNALRPQPDPHDELGGRNQFLRASPTAQLERWGYSGGIEKAASQPVETTHARSPEVKTTARGPSMGRRCKKIVTFPSAALVAGCALLPFFFRVHYAGQPATRPSLRYL